MNATAAIIRSVVLNPPAAEVAEAAEFCPAATDIDPKLRLPPVRELVELMLPLVADDEAGGPLSTLPTAAISDADGIPDAPASPVSSDEGSNPLEPSESSSSGSISATTDQKDNGCDSGDNQNHRHSLRFCAREHKLAGWVGDVRAGGRSRRADLRAGERLSGIRHQIGNRAQYGHSLPL